MAWSSYAHLPNREDEYWKILSNLKNGMSIAEADKIIADIKGKEKVQHHYRSNLAKIGLFDIIDRKIFFYYNVEKLAIKKSYLKKILLECVLDCDNVEFNILKTIIRQEQTYNLEKIVDCLIQKHPELEKNNLIRWMRPVVKLFKYADYLEKENGYGKFLQDSYLELSKELGKVIALEYVDKELKKIDNSYEIISCLENLLMNGKMKFKIELLMMPTWATQNKVYKINGDYYTHIRIKANLV